MIGFDEAKMHLKNTFDSAFTKKIGTKKQRVSMAAVCCRRIPTDRQDSIALLLWATDYAQNWKLI